VHGERNGCEGSSADDDPEAEGLALDEAWQCVIETRTGEALAERSITSLLFAAIVGGPYEGAELDSPGIAVLRAVRASVGGWAHMGGESTRCAAVPFIEIDLLTRRLDAAIEIVRRASVQAPKAAPAGAS
jgi:hypothetical protein